jgi:hypothetical protein
MDNNVSFNEEPQFKPSAGGGPKESLFTRIMMRLHLAQDEASAQTALGYVAGGAALLAVIIYFMWGR